MLKGRFVWISRYLKDTRKLSPGNSNLDTIWNFKNILRLLWKSSTEFIRDLKSSYTFTSNVRKFQGWHVEKYTISHRIHKISFVCDNVIFFFSKHKSRIFLGAWKMLEIKSLNLAIIVDVCQSLDNCSISSSHQYPVIQSAKFWHSKLANRRRKSKNWSFLISAHTKKSSSFIAFTNKMFFSRQQQQSRTTRKIPKMIDKTTRRRRIYEIFMFSVFNILLMSQTTCSLWIAEDERFTIDSSHNSSLLCSMIINNSIEDRKVIWKQQKRRPTNYTEARGV